MGLFLDEIMINLITIVEVREVGVAMSEKRAIFVINILKNIINVYFDTFFVFYFFKVANYEVLPLAKYYLSLYIFIGIGFILIRNAMKKNEKLPYFRIGISLQAIYIAMIMLLKDDIINHIYLVGIVKGLADGFYHFPKNILDSEKVSNEHRQKFDGIVTIVNRILAIVIPLLLGVLLTLFSYVELGKVFFMLFIAMFIVSFYIKDEYHVKKKFEFKKFWHLLKTSKDIRQSFLIPFLSGFSYSSGVMGTIMTIAKINNFKSNLYLGYVDSICAFLSLIVALLYTWKVKKEKFDICVYISGVAAFVSIFVFSLVPSLWTFIIYLIIRNSLVKMLEMISSQVTANLSNDEEIKDEFKSEYYCVRDVVFAISRSAGYLVLLVVCLTCGMNMNYILFLPAAALLLESIVVGKLSKKI